MTREVSIAQESLPIKGAFRIARGAKTSVEVIVVTLSERGQTGRGEGVPYARYGETVESVLAEIETIRPILADKLDRAELTQILKPGAARNAVDCALWDLEAKLSGIPAWQAAGLANPPAPLLTAFTLSLDEAKIMGESARKAAHRPLLKIKLDGDSILERLAAVRYAAPDARLIVDANEGWNLRDLPYYADLCRNYGVELIEQPLPEGQDEALRKLKLPVLLGADESFHGAADLARLKGLYQVLNIKLDKTGGLSAALVAKQAAESAGFGLMIGCMVASSLAMAPAMLLTQGAQFVDLDGPLLLEQDRVPGLRYEGALVYPPEAALWG